MLIFILNVYFYDKLIEMVLKQIKMNKILMMGITSSIYDVKDWMKKLKGFILPSNRV